MVRVRPEGWTYRHAHEFIVCKYWWGVEVNVVSGTTDETQQRLAKGLSAGILAAAGEPWSNMPRMALT